MTPDTPPPTVLRAARLVAVAALRVADAALEVAAGVLARLQARCGLDAAVVAAQAWPTGPPLVADDLRTRVIEALGAREADLSYLVADPVDDIHGPRGYYGTTPVTYRSNPSARDAIDVALSFIDGQAHPSEVDLNALARFGAEALDAVFTASEIDELLATDGCAPDGVTKADTLRFIVDYYG